MLRLYTISLRGLNGQAMSYNTTATNITIGSLTPCNNYIWNVKALTVGYSPASLNSSVTTLPLINVPGYEVSFNVIVQSDDSISVLWAVPPTLQNQSLSYLNVTVDSQSSNVPYSMNRTTYFGPSQVNSFSFGGLVPFVHYQVKLNVALCGTTAQVGSRDIFTRESVPLAGPNITSAVRTSTTTANVAWTPLSPAVARGEVTSYTVRYRPMYSQNESCSTSNANSWTVGGSKANTNANISITDLDPSTGYCVAVAATTMAGNGPYGKLAAIERKST